MQLLNNTCILINPRNMDYLQNQTNFPSKILEYLLAGRTIISTRFNGWERYKDYIVFCDSNSSEMAKIITQQIKKKEVLFNLNFKKNREYGKTFDWKNQISNFL